MSAMEPPGIRGEQNISIPHGGPIYSPHMLGRLTRVSEFESSVFEQLQNLKADIGWDSLDISDDEICVNDLKIIKEEDLVNRAFEEALKDAHLIENIPQKSQEQSCQRLEGGKDTLVTCGSSTGAPRDVKKTVSNDNVSEKRERKRRVNRETVNLEEGYVAKVRELAKIKQKQDEDKTAARLHSFNGSCRNQSAASSQIKNDKLTSLKSTSFSPKVGSSKTPEQVPVHFPEVILCLEVYHNRRTWSKTQEFLVLGRQFLTEVRDMIYCLTDEIMKKAGKHDASGYFLVEDVFCNDTRDPYAIDYSKPIFKWLEHSRNVALEKWEFIVAGEQQQHQKRKAFLDSNEKLQLPHFKVVDMQKTRFCDLGFRLGAGYLYCHQGDCKHLIVIRDMRLIHPEDVQNRAAYPLITFQSKVRFRKCSVCNIYKATKVTVDDKWAQENPCYFCDLCYYMLHYADGSLLYSDFSVYDYLHE
ncbi:snRNA-activating protein complex subunit-like isoform X1 [Coffea eugenioides]|uniref:snRNA-activating protein complex subunit-like isoform X1 n=1 Tax=Coffea eugenioides TaxID=49369 RepID=UPI000F60F4EE|nr:snRNA-activating protein complex subunit-like isoform X1 [Coffea eugenioides]